MRPLRDHYCQLMGGRELVRASGLSNWREQPLTSQVKATEEKDQHYCIGCRKNANCSYGRVFEPDLRVIDPSLIQRSDFQGLRGISIASAMLYSEGSNQPLASSSIEQPTTGKTKSAEPDRKPVQNYQMQAPAGVEISLRLLALGETATELLPTVAEAIDSFGRLNGIGYQSPVHYCIDHGQTIEESWLLDPRSLSAEACGGTIPEVTIEFLSPLLLKNCQDRGRLVPPTFADLFSNSVRTVIRAIREFAQPDFLIDAQLKDFFAASREVSAHHHQLIPFQQPSISHRSGKPKQATSDNTKSKSNYSERPLRGWLGSITFRDIPASYLPWLLHAGHLGIGSDRNRGAGLWRVQI